MIGLRQRARSGSDCPNCLSRRRLAEPPKRLAADLTSASHPVWSPDGTRLIVAGRKDQARDWWLVPLDGGAPRPTGAGEILQRLRLRPYVRSQAGMTEPDAWTPDGQWIVFSGGTGDASNLYRVAISSAGKIHEEPQRITFGTSIESRPTLSASGHLALTNQVFTSHLWSWPGDTNAATFPGQMTQITTDTTVDTWPRISVDGKHLTYYSERMGKRKLFLRNLENGTQKELAATWFFPPTAAYGAPLTEHANKVLITATPSAEIQQGTYLLEVSGGTLLLRQVACHRGVRRWPVRPCSRWRNHFRDSDANPRGSSGCIRSGVFGAVFAGRAMARVPRASQPDNAADSCDAVPGRPPDAPKRVDSDYRRETAGSRPAVVPRWKPAVFSRGPGRQAGHLRPAPRSDDQASTSSTIRGKDVPQREALDDAF